MADIGDMPMSKAKTTFTPTTQPLIKPSSEEQLCHTLISDVFHITNESGAPVKKYGEKPKTFIYEFCDDGKKFSVDDLDIILCIRLGKNKDENKFEFLFNSYERLEKHIIGKRKQSAEMITEMKNITARYFATCFSCPDTFEIQNDAVIVEDKASVAMAGQQNMEEMMAAYMNGGQMPGGANPEDLGSGLKFTFTKM